MTAQTKDRIVRVFPMNERSVTLIWSLHTALRHQNTTLGHVNVHHYSVN